MVASFASASAFARCTNAAGVFAAAPVDFERQVLEAPDQVCANDAAGLLFGDVDVMSGIRFGGRCEDRLRQPVRLPQVRWQSDAAHAAGLLVLAKQ